MVPRGRSGLAGSLPRVEFELGAPGLGALRLCLFSILGSYPPSRRRQTISESSDRLSTAVQMSRAAFGAPGCFARAGGARASTALKDRHSPKATTTTTTYYYLLLPTTTRPWVVSGWVQDGGRQKLAASTGMQR